MKKVILAAAVLGMLTAQSCKKDEPIESEDCNCGVITDDDNGITNGVAWYSITVKNNCTGNRQEFHIAQSDWMDAYVGNDFCFSNQSNW